MPPKRFLAPALVIAVLIGAGILVSTGPLASFLSSGERLRAFVQGLGAFGPVAVTVYQVVQVVVAPVPGQVVDFANGYLFGPLAGTIYSVTGVAVGTVIATGLARRYGRRMVQRLIGQRGLATVDRYLNERRLWVFFVLFLLPATPDDLLCFALGLSPIPLRRALPAAIIGRAPGITASVLVGATGSGLAPVPFLLASAAVTALVLLILPRIPVDRTAPIR